MLLLLSQAVLVLSATPFSVTLDCTAFSSPGVLPRFWRSVGYTPASYALRDDELENTALIGAVPRRGVTQVRIHYLYDLIEVLGWLPSATTPSGYALSYNWGALDHAIDFLVASRLSPGFELMGSPMGFPSLPVSFWQPYSGNGKVEPSQTLQLWRQLTADLLVRCIQRYGKEEVEAWHLETWNEPDSGWGWPNSSVCDITSNITAGFGGYWDASAAGVEDAEAATGAALFFGGTASGRAAKDPCYLPFLLNHKASGRNSITGAPVRWDYITAHVKGQSTSYMTVQGEWGVSALIRANSTWVAAGLGRLAVSNDEGDPMVGWETPEDWRGDARYGAIIPKMVNQHLLAIHDNATANNPLGWLSFDGAFMNGVGDNYTGFGERTMTARFGGPFQGASPFAFVRKNGLAAFHLLAKLPDARCAVAAPAARAPLSDNFGALAAFDGGGGDLAVLVYNSADCGDDSAPALAPSIAVRASALTPAPADGTVVAVPFALDNAPSRSPVATWATMGSPSLPVPAQLEALWAAAAGMGAPAGPPVALAVGAGGAFALPNDTAVPLPGALLWYVADKRRAPAAPPPPKAPEAFLKAENASLLGTAAREVLLRWDCADAPRSLLAYDIQFSSAGMGGPWTTVNAPPFPQDTICSFSHAAATGVAATGAYRLAAVDVWGRKGDYSEPARTKPWPLWPEEVARG